MGVYYILVVKAAKISLITVDELCVGSCVSRPVLAAESDVSAGFASTVVFGLVAVVVVVIVVFVVVVRSAEQNKVNCS